ncbi:MAG: HEAT repeat domain-containing protein [Thermoplasmata archaeon]
MNEDEIQRHIEELHSKDEATRNRAVELLSHGDAEKIVPHLLKKLRVPQVGVKCAVIKILGELEAKDAVRPLMITPLVDSDENVRRVTAEALGKIGQREAVEPLLANLPHEEDSVKLAIVVALGRLKDPKAIDLLVKELDNPKIRRAAADSLAKIGQEAAEPLVGVIKHPDPEVRMIVLDTLGTIRKESTIEPMIEMLGDTDLKVRNTAIQALAAFGDKKIPYLIKALIHPHLHVRGHASNLLVAYGENVIPALLRALTEEKAEGNKEFVDAVGNVIETVVVKMRNSGKGWEIPPEFLKMKNDLITRMISRIMILLAMGPEESSIITGIINLMDTQNEIERRNLCEILHAVVKEKEDRSRIRKIMPYLKEETYTRKSIIDTLVKVGDIAIEPLLDALVDLSNQYQSGIMLVFKAMKSQKALDKLRDMLKSIPDDRMEKLAVIQAIGRMEMPRGVSILLEYISNPSIYIRREVISALGEINSPEANDALVAALEDSDPSVRSTAAIALAGIEFGMARTALAKKEKGDSFLIVRKSARMATLFSQSPGEVNNYVEPTPAFAEKAGRAPPLDIKRDETAAPVPPFQPPPFGEAISSPSSPVQQPHGETSSEAEHTDDDLSLPPAPPAGLPGDGLPPPPGFKKDGDGGKIGPGGKVITVRKKN